MAEEEPLAELVLEILRRRRRAKLKEILDELYPLLPEERRYSSQVVERVMRLLARLEATAAVLRVREVVSGPVFRYVWYDASTLRRLIARRPGQRFNRTQLSQILNIPLSEVDRLLQMAVERGWLVRVTPEEYQIPQRMYRVQKMRAWKTAKRPQFYQVRFGVQIDVPQQLVLDGFADTTQTDELKVSVHGAVRLVVYTTSPERWPEERLERIMRGFFAQHGITMEIYSNRPYIETSQAYEAKEVEPDEKPQELELDEVDVWLWVGKDDGSTWIYHYTRRLGAWEIIEKYKVRG